MKHLHSPTAVPVLALCLALAAPALAQQAPTPAAAPAAAGASAAPAAPDRVQRQVNGRALMTPQERQDFRRQMQEATPDQQQSLWQQKQSELEQRAAQRGMVLAERNSGAGGKGDERGKSRNNRAEGGRGEPGGWVLITVTRQPPRAP